MKNKIISLLKNKLFWLILSIISSVTFGFIYETPYDLSYKLMLISLIYPVCLTIVMLVYAWIINPIKSLKKDK